MAFFKVAHDICIGPLAAAIVIGTQLDFLLKTFFPCRLIQPFLNNGSNFSKGGSET